ncbi:hypothetical protein, partial [Escherichia coli]|uniref:hypothetical protein n=1 Tax=Escherichia coli TaxID=562 RepID=UPI001441D9C0
LYADNDIDVFLVGWSGTLAPEAWIGGEVVSEEDILDVHDIRLAQKDAMKESNSEETEKDRDEVLPILADNKQIDSLLNNENGQNAMPFSNTNLSMTDKSAFAHLRIANNTELRANRNKKAESLTKEQDISIERIIVEEDKA